MLHLLFPIITPTRSPFLTPKLRSPRARALMCLSNSSKSQAKCEVMPRFLDGGPPWLPGASDLHMRAGREACCDRIWELKYEKSVLLLRGGWQGPSTDESVRVRFSFGCLRKVSGRKRRQAANMVLLGGCVIVIVPRRRVR